MLVSTGIPASLPASVAAPASLPAELPLDPDEGVAPDATLPEATTLPLFPLLPLAAMLPDALPDDEPEELPLLGPTAGAVVLEHRQRNRSPAIATGVFLDVMATLTPRSRAT